MVRNRTLPAGVHLLLRPVPQAKTLPAFVTFSLVKCEVGEKGEMFHCLIYFFYILLCRLHVVRVFDLKEIAEGATEIVLLCCSTDSK